MSFGSFDPTKKASFSNRTKKFYLEAGSNIYRVLPPVKSLKDKNKIAQYWSVIWLTDSRGKKRPVSSIFRKNKEVVLQHDPLITRIEEIRAQIEMAKTNGTNPMTVAAMEEEAKRIYNKKVYALNVLSAGGELGVLEIPYTSYQSLEQRLTELNKQGVDAIGVGPDRGIYLDFKRMKDERGRTVYSVDAATKTTKNPNGDFVLSYIRAPISEEDATRLADQASDLSQLYKTYTLEEMTALASMDQRVFDAVFARPDSVNNEQVTDEPEEASMPGAQAVGFNGFNDKNVVAQNAPLNPTNPQNLTGNANPTVLTAPSAAQQGPSIGFSNGSVVNNSQVKSFLFPDKK